MPTWAAKRSASSGARERVAAKATFVQAVRAIATHNYAASDTLKSTNVPIFTPTAPRGRCVPVFNFQFGTVQAPPHILLILGLWRFRARSARCLSDAPPHVVAARNVNWLTSDHFCPTADFPGEFARASSFEKGITSGAINGSPSGAGPIRSVAHGTAGGLLRLRWKRPRPEVPDFEHDGRRGNSRNIAAYGRLPHTEQRGEPRL